MFLPDPGLFFLTFVTLNFVVNISSHGIFEVFNDNSLLSIIKDNP